GAILQAAFEMAWLVRVGQHLALPELRELCSYRVGGDPVYDTGTRTTSIEPGHQSRALRRTAVDAAPQAQPAVIAMHARRQPHVKRQIRLPDQRAVTEYPQRVPVPRREKIVQRKGEFFVAQPAGKREVVVHRLPLPRRGSSKKRCPALQPPPTSATDISQNPAAVPTTEPKAPITSGSTTWLLFMKVVRSPSASPTPPSGEGAAL